MGQDPLRVVAYVPVKRLSQRVPGKNFRSFSGGAPLLTYIMNALAACDLIDERFLLCSDPLAASYMPATFEFAQEDPELDAAPINAVMQAFAAQVPADVYVLAHATSPFLRPSSIMDALDKVLTGEYDSALTVHTQQVFLWDGGGPVNYDPSAIPRTQDLPPLHVETTGLYIYRREVLEELGTRIGHRPYLAEVSFVESMDIDTVEDFELADAIFSMMSRRQEDRSIK